jgi:hypothetical protein
LSAAALPAQVWTWHAVDAVVSLGHTDLGLHARPGTHGGELAYLRTGAWLRRPVHRRIAVQGGYVYTTDKDAYGWDGSSRWYGGAEISAASFQFRTLVERFFTAPEYFRYRQRALWTTRRRISPVLSLELFLDRHGVRAARPYGGLRWRVNAWSTLDAGYFHDARRERAGGVRQVISTTWTIRPRGR